jgi:hypothetical protein
MAYGCINIPLSLCVMGCTAAQGQQEAPIIMVVAGFYCALLYASYSLVNCHQVLKKISSIADHDG